MIVNIINTHVWRDSVLKFSAFESRFFRLRNSKSKQIAPKPRAEIVLNVGEGIMLGISIIPINDKMIYHL